MSGRSASEPVALAVPARLRSPVGAPDNPTHRHPENKGVWRRVVGWGFSSSRQSGLLSFLAGTISHGSHLVLERGGTDPGVCRGPTAGGGTGAGRTLTRHRHSSRRCWTQRSSSGTPLLDVECRSSWASGAVTRATVSLARWATSCPGRGGTPAQVLQPGARRRWGDGEGGDGEK